MDITTNNTNGDNSQVESPLGAVVTEDATTDPILNKHLDMAIEAQDGKKVDEATTTESKETKQEGADKTEGGKTPKDDSTGKPKDTPAQPDAGKPAKEGKEAKGDTRGPKDLVLKGQGPDGTDLVVKGGPERRFYEQLQVSKQKEQHLNSQLQNKDTELNTMRTQLETMQKSVQAVNGLPPQELAVAARMFGDLKRDPAGTLKKLLAEAVALGHTVDGIAAGVDVNAITAAVRAELAQSTTVNKEPTEQEVAQQAEKEVEQFYSRFSDARVHDALLGAVLRDHPALTLEDAYFQLKNAFIEKGFDWSRSLEDNLAASSQEQTTANTTPAPKPVPTGGSAVGNEGSTPAEKHGDVVMSENADYGDIIKADMREQNLNV